MKQKIIFLLSVCLLSVAANAQAKYGVVHYDSLFKALPEYEEVQLQMEGLKAQYEQEKAYNEESFRRQFAEFIQGQKGFSQNILLKRQGDLQNAMERGIAFREEANRLLQKAERELLAPLHERLQKAIDSVGIARHYDMIVKKNENRPLFLHPRCTEDATPFVQMALQGLAVPAPAPVVAPEPTLLQSTH